jgi:hypothetical protein
MTAQNSQHGLNSIQESLLRLFSRPMTEAETLQLKQIMVQHFGSQLKDEINNVVAEKGYTQTDFENLLNSRS